MPVTDSTTFPKKIKSLSLYTYLPLVGVLLDKIRVYIVSCQSFLRYTFSATRTENFDEAVVEKKLGAGLFVTGSNTSL